MLHEELRRELLNRLDIDEVFVADSTISGQRIGELVSMGLREDVPLSFLASKYYPETAKPAGIRFLDDLHVVSPLPRRSGITAMNWRSGSWTSRCQEV